MLRIILILTLYISIFSMLSCSKCKQQIGFYRPLTYKVPYSGLDTINFVDTVGNTLTFVGQGVSPDWVQVYGDGMAYCPEDPTVYQNAYYSYKELNKKMTLLISNFNYKNSTSSQIMSLNINGNEINYVSDYLTNNIFAIPQLNLNGKTYFNVHKETSSKSTLKFAFYSNTFGIISFKVDSMQWYLK